MGDDRYPQRINPEELEERYRRERVALTDAWFEGAGIPKRFLAVKLSDEERNKAAEAMKSTAVLISGIAGAGKTHAAVGIFREILHRERRLQEKGRQGFATMKEIILDIQDTYGGKSETTTKKVVEFYSNIPLLIIDDIGVEIVTPDALQWIEYIVDRRWSNEEFTIYTTNLSMSKIALAYKDRIASRLSDAGQLQLTGKDRRGTGA